MRFVICIVIAALLPASALAAKGPMSLSSAQAAAAGGDQQAAAALATHDEPRYLSERVRQAWSSERSMRQRLPPGPLSPRRRAAVLRVEVSGTL